MVDANLLSAALVCGKYPGYHTTAGDWKHRTQAKDRSPPTTTGLVQTSVVRAKIRKASVQSTDQLNIGRLFDPPAADLPAPGAKLMTIPAVSTPGQLCHRPGPAF